MKAIFYGAAMLFMISVAVADEAPASSVALAPLTAHVSANRDGKAPNSIDFATLKGDRSQLPIGVFDSGIGGLGLASTLPSRGKNRAY